MLDTDVEVRVELGQTEILLKDLMKLKPGDVIPLDHDVNGEFDVQIENVKKFKGYHGVNHGSVAVQVTKKINKE